MVLVNLLAYLVAFWVLAVVGWLTVARRQWLDPRIYILYGLFHWLIFGQVGTLLGGDFYEPKPFFDESIHAKAAVLLAASVLALSVGYAMLPKVSRKVDIDEVGLTPPVTVPPRYRLEIKRLVLIALFWGIIGHGVMLYVQKSAQMVVEYRFLPLLITYWGTAGSVLSIHILLFERPKLRGLGGLLVQLFLALIAGVGIFASNVMLIFPLLYAVYAWYRYRLDSGPQISRRKIIIWILVIFIVGLWSIVFKVAVQDYLSTGMWDIPVYTMQIMHRWLTFDLFNPEGYGIVLHSMEIYAEGENLLGGKSFLVLFPFLHYFFEDIRGFGRIIVLDIFGPSYQFIHVGWGVPPIGELVANFGYLSPIIFYFFLGLGSRYLYEGFWKSKRPWRKGVYGVILPWLAVQQRGDFLNGFVFPCYVVLLVGIAFWISERRLQ